MQQTRSVAFLVSCFADIVLVLPLGFYCDVTNNCIICDETNTMVVLPRYCFTQTTGVSSTYLATSGILVDLCIKEVDDSADWLHLYVSPTGTNSGEVAIKEVLYY